MGLELNFNIDPRTKIIILVLLSFMVFNDVSLYISGILVLIPCICLLFSNHVKSAVIYIIIYIIAKCLQNFILPTSTGILTILFVSFSYIATRMLSIMMMGYYTINTTKVSEFVTSMEKSKVPKSIIIPLSVVFRYIPSVIEEIKSITNAMKMRGFGLNFKSLKNLLKLVEFYMIPILISAVKTSDELSAASLTRGLSNPKQRTHLYEVKFKIWDFLLLAITFIGFGFYIYNFIGGRLFA
ncbi:energy-coupling factor transporter transmembrane component T [Methanobrevibacter sp. V74]|uniref:energy-coupling factor transporter transmembrane component T n=1 Tax=Methanobrevibacter sp. V74 TaxID=3064279 RepID=UPI0027339742|nr:energy-coupling factor transporter transmembrane component T [Methanobrevibacter sp. V74]